MRTAEEVKSTQSIMVQYFTETFSKVIPVLGNNDVITHNNIMAYDDQYSEFVSTWTSFNLNLGQDFIKGGYYVQDLAPNLRTINTNTMAFFKKNELLYTDCDVPGPGRSQLDWLKKSLEDTRAQKSKAYILYVFPGFEFYPLLMHAFLYLVLMCHQTVNRTNTFINLNAMMNTIAF